MPISLIHYQIDEQRRQVNVEARMSPWLRIYFYPRLTRARKVIWNFHLNRLGCLEAFYPIKIQISLNLSFPAMKTLHFSLQPATAFDLNPDIFLVHVLLHARLNNLIITFITVRRATNQFNQKAAASKCGKHPARKFPDRDKAGFKERDERNSFRKQTCAVLQLLLNPFSMLVIQSICCFSAMDEEGEWESRKFFCAWRWGWGRNCYQNEIDKLFAQWLCLFNMLSTSRTFSFYWNRPTRALDNGALHLLKTCLSSF